MVMISGKELLFNQGVRQLFCIINLSLLLSSAAWALQLQPDTVVTIDLKDGDVYRGLEYTGNAGFGAGVSLDFDLFRLECSYSGYDGGSNRGFIRDRTSWEMAYEAQEQPCRVNIGLGGEHFEGDRGLQRYDIFFQAGYDFRRWKNSSLILDVSVDPDNSNALYSCISFTKTFNILSNVDIDINLGAGAGDAHFAENMMELVTTDALFSDRWYDAHASAFFVGMTSWCDLSPFVRYDAVLESSARDFLSVRGLRADSWTSGLTVKFYWN